MFRAPEDHYCICTYSPEGNGFFEIIAVVSKDILLFFIEENCIEDDALVIPVKHFYEFLYVKECNIFGK